jgi:NitT/TauT family transport system substrate-binding protein
MAWLRTLTAATLALGILFCSSFPVKSADLIKVHVATLAADTGADVFFARDQGFFRDAGLDVEVDSQTTGPGIISALTAGTYDFGAANPISIVQAREHGLPIVIVAPGAVHVKGVFDAGMMVPANSTIKTAKDLEGKTVAVVTVGGIAAVALQAWIARNGGDVKAVKLIEIPFSSMSAGLEQGRFDAAIMTEPFMTAAKPLIKQFVDPYQVISSRFLFDGWIASEPWLAKNPDVAKRFISALRAAHAWANTHHPETAVMLAKNTKIDAQLASTMVRSQFGDTLNPSQLQPVIDLMVNAGQLDKAVPASDLIWKGP